jgi:hypothetical protein
MASSFAIPLYEPEPARAALGPSGPPSLAAGTVPHGAGAVNPNVVPESPPAGYRTPQLGEAQMRAAELRYRGATAVTGAMTDLIQTVADVSSKYIQEATRRQNQLEALRIVADAQTELDAAYVTLQGSTDVFSFYPAFQETKARIMRDAFERAKNDEQRFLVERELTPYLHSVNKQALVESGRKRVEYLVGQATQVADQEISRAINADDPETIFRSLSRFEKTVEGLRNVMGEDDRTKFAKSYLTKFYKERLEREVRERPGAFLETRYKDYQPGGLFPDTPQELVSEAKVRAAKEQQAISEYVYRMQERHDRAFEQQLKAELSAKAGELWLRLTDPAGKAPRPTPQEVETFALYARQYVDRAVIDKLVERARQPLLEGGVTDPDAKRRLEQTIILSPERVTPGMILNAPHISDADKTAMLNDWQRRMRIFREETSADKVASHWAYKRGREYIKLRLGGTTEDNPLGLIMLKPEERERLADALTEFEQRMRAPGANLDAGIEVAEAIVARRLGTAKPSSSRSDTGTSSTTTTTTSPSSLPGKDALDRLLRYFRSTPTPE